MMNGKFVRRTAFLLVVFLQAAFISAQNQPPATLAEYDDLATTLVSLKSKIERESLLAKNKALMTPDLRKALIRQGNAQLMAGRYSTAFDIYGLAQNIATQIGDKEGVASASLDIGTVYYFQANYPAALEHYQKARELFTEVTNHYESAKALSGVALIYKEQRRDTEALTALQQVLKEFTSLGDNQEAANTLNMIGTIHYGQGNYAAAAEAFSKSSEANGNLDSTVRLADALYMQGDYQQALVHYKRTLERVSRGEIGVFVASLNGAANSAYYLGDYEQALQHYQRSVTIQRTQLDKVGLANALKGVANVHRSRGDYPAALEFYFESLKVAQEIKAPLGTTLGSIGLVRALQGDYTAALDYYSRALKEFQASANKIEWARVLTLKGNAYYRQGQYDSALESYRQALELREEMADQPGQGDILAGIGSTLIRQMKYSEGLDSFEKALRLFDSVKNHERMADVLTRISETFLLQNDFIKALSAAESAVSLASQADNREVLWYARMLTGKAQQKLERGPQAYQSFINAVSIVEALRAEPAVIGGDHNRSLPYLSTVDFLMSERRPAEAFHYAERAKVQVLIDLLTYGNGLTHKGLTADERLEEKRLSAEVASSEIQLEREAQQRTWSETRRLNLRARRQQARSASVNFRRRLFTAKPDVQVARGELPPLKMEEIRSLIGDTSTALLEYTVTENNTYLFVLTADKAPAKGTERRRATELNLKAYSLGIKQGELATRVRDFEQLLTAPADNFHESARDLYELLLKPAADQITLKTKLVIVPDGILWRLPFEALQPAENHYLIDHMQVSYGPSLSALREMKKQQVSPRQFDSLLVAYANPTLPKEFNTRMELARAATGLSTTSGQEEEIGRAANTFGMSQTRLVVGPDASEERLEVDSSRKKILHLAVPAVVDETSPMSSFVGLSATAQRDGFLQAREVVNLRTNAELTILSGSQRVGDLNGTGLVGVSWSWKVAGTPALMASRWRVDSPALPTLLTKFYANVKPSRQRGVTKARALHQAMLSVRQTVEFEHPYHWANFVMIGDAR